jgi:hypothetical protein
LLKTFNKKVMSEISESVLHLNTLVLELNAQCECRSLNLSERYKEATKWPSSVPDVWCLSIMLGYGIPGVRHQTVVVQCTSQGSINCVTCEGGTYRLSPDVTNQLPSFAM